MSDPASDPAVATRVIQPDTANHPQIHEIAYNDETRQLHSSQSKHQDYKENLELTGAQSAGARIADQ